jgi:hypothetical protein
MDGFLPMETNVAWVLFVVTMILHSMTFILLQFVADKFQKYMSLTDGDVNFVVPLSADTLTPPHSNNSSTTPIQTRMYYQELHETLDVSIFR